MKTVIITGAGGFLGGHLVHFFLNRGVRVVAVLHKEAEDTMQSATKRQIQKTELLARIAPENLSGLVFFEGDITNLNDMRRLFSENSPDTLVHAAALLIPPKEAEYKDKPIEYKEANDKFIEINQAKTLADCAAEYQESHELYCLFVSTVYVFDLKKPVINESTEHASYPPSVISYPKSKEEAQIYWESKGLNLAVIYPPQIYGAHQFTPAIMPRLIKKMLFNEGPVISVSGAMKPIHVNNMIRLMYSLCLFTQTGCFCVDGDHLLSLEEIALTLQKAATALLTKEDMTPYSAFEVTSTTASPPKIDDSKLMRFFASKYPEEDAHSVIPFEDTASEMVASHWEHSKTLR